MTLTLIQLLMALAWTAVTGIFSLPNFLFGLAVAWLALYLIRDRSGMMHFFGRARQVFSLAALFIIELVKSSWSVARMVARPNMNVAPGIISYPLRVRSDVEITLLANLITLTPGTLSVDVSDDRKVLHIHVVDSSDIEQTRKSIADGFERRIMEVFE